MSETPPAVLSRGQRFVLACAPALVRLLHMTWRVRLVNDDGWRARRARGDPFVFALWHGHMLPLLVQHRDEGIAVLISEHRDGELIARIAKRFGCRTVRGSTTRGGTRALLAIVRVLSDGADVAITPDGPRGPAYSFAPGTLIAAQRAGVPIVAMGVSASRAWRLRSWDAFLIPKPFATVTIAYSVPVFVDAPDARLAAKQAARFQTLMNDTVAQAQAGTPFLATEAVWWSDAPWTRVVRGVLVPLSLLFRAVTGIRNWLYDVRILRTIPSPIPVVSVGNISVGGTGKTPVAAYIVQRLCTAGRHPAIVMRGYGKDETEVHALLNPGIRIYADPDRVAGIARAEREGADVIVLDDAFQHRRAGRDADIVLVSAERWREREWTLPAGSLREPARALRRATLICVTHRVAGLDAVQRVTNAMSRIAPDVPVASLRLGIGALHPMTASEPTIALEQLAGSRVLAIAGIGDTRSFFGQLAEAGAIVDSRPFADHHAYTAADVASILASTGGHKYFIATLKDAVKLRVMWPAKGPILWYVSQAVEVSGGASFIDLALTKLLPKSRSEHPLAAF